MADRRINNGPKEFIGLAGGVNNRAPASRMPKSDRGADLYVADATNLLLTEEGYALKRPGATQLESMINAHSLWSDQEIDYALLVNNGTVHSWRNGNLLDLAFAVDLPLAYCTVNGSVYLSDGSKSARVLSHNTLEVWGMDVPPTPVVSALSAGGLHAGQYQVTCTYKKANGEESGAPLPALVTVAEGGGIQIDSIPNHATYYAISYYVTGPDDHHFKHADNVLVGSASHTIGRHIRGEDLSTLHGQRPYGGRALCSHSGIIYMGDGNIVWYTQPLRQNIMFPQRDFMPPFPRDVQLIMAQDDGLYIATDKLTYWFAGTDPTEMNVAVADHNGAIRHSGIYIDGDRFSGSQFSDRGKTPVWIGTDGNLCIGRPGGQIQKPNDTKLQIGQYGSAAQTLIEQDGARFILQALSNPQGEVASFGDRWEVSEVISAS